jgi:hypothetical protein
MNVRDLVISWKNSTKRLQIKLKGFLLFIHPFGRRHFQARSKHVDRPAPTVGSGRETASINRICQSEGDITPKCSQCW